MFAVAAQGLRMALVSNCGIRFAPTIPLGRSSKSEKQKADVDLHHLDQLLALNISAAFAGIPVPALELELELMRPLRYCV